MELERLGFKLRHPRMHGPARSQWDENLLRQYIEKVLEKCDSTNSSSDQLEDKGNLQPNVAIPEQFLIRSERSSEGCVLS